MKEFNISDFEPKNDYILVLGTSHSFGACEVKSKDQITIPENNIWCNLLANKLNCDLFNLSIEGNDNQTMISQLEDYIHLVKNKSKCLMIIAEVRMFDMSDHFSNDMVEDFNYTINRSYPDIFQGKDISSVIKHENFKPLNDVLMRRYTINHTDRKSITNLLKSVYKDSSKDLPTALVKDMQRLSTTFREITATTTKNYVKDLYSIKSLSFLCHMAEIPFHWFCWDRNQLDKINKAYVDELFRFNTTVFDSKLDCFKFNASDEYIKIYGFDKFKKNHCDCGHMTEPFHEFVAEKIYSEINAKAN